MDRDEQLSEEKFDGFYVVDCPRCGKGKAYYKEGEGTIICPYCLGANVKVLKKVKKETSGYRRYYSVNTEESFFNY